MRDDFSKQTITDIAKGAGYRCSNPECTRPTVSAKANQDGIVTIGVAAHVCAASSGGPRYDPAQTLESRRGKDNGVWLCQNCARLIDADPNKFTVEVLIGWKRQAQERAFREIVAWRPAATDEATRIGLNVAADTVAAPEIDQLFSKLRVAAATDLATYKRGAMWSVGSVELTLNMQDDQGAPSFSVSRLPPAFEIAPEITIVAAPGTGKTTTLLQLAGHALTGNLVLPLYFRLGDWAVGTANLVASISQRSAFAGITQEELLHLARHGRILLLLDGWNELDVGSHKRLRVELEGLRREFPQMRMVISTRRRALDVPTSGPRVEIQPLSEDQQMAIARATLGAAGEKIVDEAWRTTGVRELMAIPLYLSALLSVRSKGAGPETKEEVLRLFVEQHEQAHEHAEALHGVLFGCHVDVLAALASHLNRAGSTAMADADARRIVTAVLARLRDGGQIAGQPEPLAVLETLTSRHVLTRSGGAIAFQHQQFQEWFASHEVANLMRANSNGDVEARDRLRVEVLDQPAWEESIFFAAERVSREEGGAGIVAHAVHLALPIDPMLAAEMISRSACAVWDAVKSDILAFVDRWHQPGKVDRAVRFMIMTGRPEFAPRIWPLASSDNSQIQLPTLRTAPRFRPSVLGPDLQANVAALPEATREHLLALIAYESGVDGMDLAVDLAKVDQSPKVQAEVAMYLLFRRADRHVADLLTEAHEATWELIAKRVRTEEIGEQAVAARLRKVRDKMLAQAVGPAEQLGVLIEQPPNDPVRDGAIAAAIADPRFPIRGQHGGASLHFAQERAPKAVVEGLRRRLEAGLELPFHASEILASMETTDEGPIAAAILDTTRDNRNGDEAAVLAGRKTTGALVDQYLSCAQAVKDPAHAPSSRDQYHRVRSRIAATRAPSLISAVLERAATDDPDTISWLATLVSLHGDDAARKTAIAVDLGLKPQLIAFLRSWVDTMISSPGGGRYHLCELANAIGRFGFLELLPELRRLLDEDLARLRKAREEFLEARKRGDSRAASDASMRYNNQYRQAFTRLGKDEVGAVAVEYLEDRLFGVDAALILKAISDSRLKLSETRVLRQWPWFDGVVFARADRAANKIGSDDKRSQAIFLAVDRLTKQETDKEGQFLAIQLARIGLGMPHSDQDELIARVMSLPQPMAAKRELLSAMAMDGQVLDAALIMQAIDDWLDEATKSDQIAWHKRQNTWEIEPWLELLPFTERPEAVIEGLAKVKAFYGKGWPQRWERVLTAVACLPGTEGEILLASLARAHKDIASELDWMKTILGCGSASAVRLFVDLYIEGVFGTEPHGADPWHVGRELAKSMQKYPELKGELKKRYEGIGSGRARAMIENIFGECGDGDDLIAMVNKYAANKQPYDSQMASVVRAVALWHEPVSDGSNAYHVHPAPTLSLRRSLFRLSGPPQQAVLARSCLTALDVLRDEHGFATNDTRHPDVLSGLPWPIEAEPEGVDFAANQSNITPAMLEFRNSRGQRVSADQFFKDFERSALDMGFAKLEELAHGAAASIVDPETGRHADVFVRRNGDQGVVITTKGSQAFARELERRLGVEQGTVMTEQAAEVTASPIVYLAHASEDKETLARPLAERLMANGIDVWLDEWEISAGDSLKRKMEQGLESCTHFLVLLTPRSIGKPWVETEIDAGFVRAVGGKSRFIGLRIGAEIDQLSAFLTTLSCPAVDLARTEDVEKVIADILGVSRKPPLGEKPRYVRNVAKDTGGWSASAMAVAEHLVKSSQFGCKFDPQVTVAAASAATGLPEQDVRLGVLDLVEAGLIEKTKEMGAQAFYPLPALFVEFDPRCMGFDNERDAVAIANWLISNDRSHVKVEEIAAAFPDIPPRQLNSALNYLEGAKAVEARRYLGGGHWTYSAVTVSDRTLRFAKNRS